MIASLLCIAALVVTFLCGRRSLGNGLIALLAVGYAYGIVRANLPTEASHFIFDGAAIGLYFAAFMKTSDRSVRYRCLPLQPWLAVLIGWPVLMFFVPVQDWVIQLVGLRGAIFFLPFLMIGARLDEKDFHRLATGIAALNIIVLAVGVSEFFFGIERFFPHNAVTDLIYKTHDLAGDSYRIPSTFVVASAYGGVMTFTFPFLAGSWAQSAMSVVHRRLMEFGMLASGCGVFLSGSRTSALLLLCLGLALFTSLRLKTSHRIGLMVLLAAVLWVTTKDERLQRFTTLSDTEYVRDRIGWSVNTTLIDELLKSPMGNGLGGGGTSVPYFLQDRLRDPVLMENEYARIMIEQGVFGLIVWVSFVVWLLIRAWPRGRQLYVARLLQWVAVAFSFVAAPMGTGLLTSVPMTALLMLSSGWLIARSREEGAAKVPVPLHSRFQTTGSIAPDQSATSPATQ